MFLRLLPTGLVLPKVRPSVTDLRIQYRGATCLGIHEYDGDIGFAAELVGLLLEDFLMHHEFATPSLCYARENPQ